MSNLLRLLSPRLNQRKIPSLSYSECQMIHSPIYKFVFPESIQESATWHSAEGSWGTKEETTSKKLQSFSRLYTIYR